MSEDRRGVPAVLENLPETPVLPDWIGLTEAGERLGVTRQHAYRLAKSGHFQSLHRIGKSFVVVVREEEIDEMVQARRNRNREKDAE